MNTYSVFSVFSLKLSVSSSYENHLRTFKRNPACHGQKCFHTSLNNVPKEQYGINGIPRSLPEFPS